MGGLSPAGFAFAFGCAAGEWAAAIVTVVAGIGAGTVVIIHALRRDPPYRQP